MNKLSAGAGKVCITPDDESMPYLYGLRGKKFTGVIDDIYVRVLLFDNGITRAMLVSWDLDKAPAPEDMIPKISAEMNVPEDNILFFAVHTHTAPMHSARPNDGPNAKAKQDFDVIAATDLYEGVMYAALRQAAKEAQRKLAPCRIGFGTGESYIGEYRIQDYFKENEDGSLTRIGNLGSNPKRPIDRTLSLLKVQKEDGSPIAFLVNLPVHCCVMIGNNYDGKGGMGISGDIAGSISHHMEEKFAGSVCLWSSGAAGDINPVMLNEFFFPSFEDGSPFEYNKVMSSETPELMLKMLSGRHFADVVLLNRTISCSECDGNIASAVIRTSTPARNVIPGPKGTPPTYEPAPENEPYQVTLRALRLGDMTFVGADGELFSSFGCIIRETIGGNTVVINHERSANSPAGYIIDDEGFDRCTRPDGTMDGIPDIFKTRNIPGHMKNAITEAAATLKEMLG